MGAALSMTRAVSFRLLFSVIPHALFCHSERQRGIHSWMLRCAQHDRMGTANLTLWSLSFARRGMFWRKPKQGEVARSSKHFFVIPSIFFCVIPSALFCHSERSEESSVDAALSVTGTLTSPQPSPSQGEEHLFFFIPSASEESSMDASLRSA